LSSPARMTQVPYFSFLPSQQVSKLLQARVFIIMIQSLIVISLSFHENQEWGEGTTSFKMNKHHMKKSSSPLIPWNFFFKGKVSRHPFLCIFHWKFQDYFSCKVDNVCKGDMR
jgi:hypothetical protein